MRRALIQWRRSGLSLSCGVCHQARTISNTFNPEQPSTWKKTPWSSVVSGVKKRFNPTCSESQFDKALAKFAVNEDVKTFEREIQPNVTGMGIAVSSFLDACLNNKRDPVQMPLSQRDGTILYLAENLAHAKATNNKAAVYRLLSPRGSGKTQLVKHVVGTRLTDLCARGGVVVVECQNSWSRYLHLISPLCGTAPTDETVGRFVCGIICKHLNDFHRRPTRCYCVPGLDLKPNDDVKSLPNVTITTVDKAYEAWMGEIEYDSDDPERNTLPVIIFDTIENLPVSSSVKSSKDRNRTFLEAVATYTPAGCRMLFVGTSSAEMAASELSPSNVVATELEPLQPLKFENFLKAYEAWSALDNVMAMSGDMQKDAKLIHYLCAGLPRYLRLFCLPAAGYPLLGMRACWGTMLTKVTQSVKTLASVDWNNDTVLGLLIAGTRYRVKSLDDQMPVLGSNTNTKAYRVMIPHLLLPEPVGTMWQFSVAPLVVKGLLLSAPPNTMPGWPPGLSLEALYQFDCDPSDPATGVLARGKPFERLVAHALVARWYVLSLVSGQTTIPLTDVLSISAPGPQNPTDAMRKHKRKELQYTELSKLTVDFSGGVSPPGSSAAQNSLELSPPDHGNRAQHDIVFYAMEGSQSVRVGVQVRFGTAKTASDLATQAEGVSRLLVVHQKEYETPMCDRTSSKSLKTLAEGGHLVFVDASQFCHAELPLIAG